MLTSLTRSGKAKEMHKYMSTWSLKLKSKICVPASSYLSVWNKTRIIFISYGQIYVIKSELCEWNKKNLGLTA